MDVIEVNESRSVQMQAMVMADVKSQKFKYFYFLPSSKMEFTTECYVNPQMLHARIKYV